VRQQLPPVHGQAFSYGEVETSTQPHRGSDSVTLSQIGGSGAHCVTYFENSNCAFVESEGGTDFFGPGVCQNVNTGGPVNSFMCSPTTGCQV
jgi:hypothetical protein